MLLVVLCDFLSVLLASIHHVNERYEMFLLMMHGREEYFLLCQSKAGSAEPTRSRVQEIFRPSENYSGAGIAKVPEKQIFYESSQHYKIFSLLRLTMTMIFVFVTHQVNAFN